jgi:secreted PhoX family phosphatase
VQVSRRRFVRQTAASAAFLGLGRYAAAQGPGHGPSPLQPYLNEADGYGPLVDDPARILDLPDGFSYRILSRAGERMTDGFILPAQPDGMAAFQGPDGNVILVRNHELTPDRPPHEGPFGYAFELLADVDARFLYDRTTEGRPHLSGATTLVYDPVARRTEAQFLKLAGTIRNCAGGRTPWDTWISCEEAVDLAGELNMQDHGYNFEVPASAGPGLIEPVPLKAMGRFNHEAVAVDPETGIVYQTEDRVDGLFYRFLPATPGQLTDGGRLQALCLRDGGAFDTRNYAETGEPRLVLDNSVPVRWIDVDDVESPEDDLRTRGAELGAALFARGEGIWFGDGELYFTCTNGGLARRGQVFRYVPSPAEGTPGEAAAPGGLTLHLEPNNALLLESVDNITIAPWGDLILCEDNVPEANVVTDYGTYNFLRGVTPAGRIYTLARNRYPGGSELAGACFAPDGETMFLNIQAAGLTLALTGPWGTRRE